MYDATYIIQCVQTIYPIPVVHMIWRWQLCSMRHLCKCRPPSGGLDKPWAPQLWCGKHSIYLRYMFDDFIKDSRTSSNRIESIYIWLVQTKHIHSIVSAIYRIACDNVYGLSILCIDVLKMVKVINPTIYGLMRLSHIHIFVMEDIVWADQIMAIYSCYDVYIT